MKALILMTALVPTIAHQKMVEFALFSGYEVDLVISSRSFEPVPGSQRVQSFRDTFRSVVVHHHADDNAPQNDDGTQQFWAYWFHAIGKLTNYKSFDVVIGSEPYCQNLADLYNAQYIPFDSNRELYPVKGTTVRQNIFDSFHLVMPEFKKYLKTPFVIFGQESVGKTTMSKAIGSRYSDAMWVPEFARQYLETVGKELTAKKMQTIFESQMAWQALAEVDPHSLWSIQDTDLLSTIGYYRIGGFDLPDWFKEEFHYRKAALYFLMPDDVPFEEDQLRYGGNVRESTYEFWKDLLDEFECNYIEVPKGTFFEKRTFIEEKIHETMRNKLEPITKFVRD